MEQTFEEFMAELRMSVDAFEKHWREKNKQDPDNYPMSLMGGDWFEQFMSYGGEADD